MAAQTCPDCDHAGDGNCRRCHGEGKTLSDKSSGTFGAELRCSQCKGSGHCPTCGGAGEVEVGGEGG
jgi:DnaJ-class molecular chaperone